MSADYWMLVLFICILSTITNHKPLQIQFYVYSIFYRYNRSDWATETTRMIAVASCYWLMLGGGLVDAHYNSTMQLDSSCVDVMWDNGDGGFSSELITYSEGEAVVV